MPLEVFSGYGLEFQRRFVPELEQEFVESVRRQDTGFSVSLSSGETFYAQRVVVAAVGLTHYAHLPKGTGRLATGIRHSQLPTLSSNGLRGKEVGVLGAGASALDLAALLHQAGSSVQVIARGSIIRFHDPPKTLTPSRMARIRRPFTGIGPGWRLWMCANLPLVFRLMPEDFRVDQVHRVLGPAPGWFTKEQVVGKVKFQLESTVTGAEVEGQKVSLHIKNAGGQSAKLQFDHLIAATGYRTDVRRLPFLDGGDCFRAGPRRSLAWHFRQTSNRLFRTFSSSASQPPTISAPYCALRMVPALQPRVSLPTSGGLPGARWGKCEVSEPCPQSPMQQNP